MGSSSRASLIVVDAVRKTDDSTLPLDEQAVITYPHNIYSSTRVQ